MMTEEDFMALGDPVTNEPTEPSEGSQEPVDIITEPAEPTEPTEPSEGGQTQTQPELPANIQQPAQSAQPVDPQIIRRSAEDFRRRMEAQQAAQRMYGMENPYTGRPIENQQDYAAYMEAHRAATLFSRIQNGQATPDELSAFVKNEVEKQLTGSPDLQRARAAADKAEAAERQAQYESGRSRLMADIEALNREIPDCGIKTIEDIKDPAMVAYMRRGIGIADAYYLTHRQEIAQKQQAAAKQAVINQSAGKAHLKTTSGGAAEDTSVSEDMIESFRKYYPHATREEIIKMCKKYGQ